MTVSLANRGVGWERALELWHDRYRRAAPPCAVIFRTPPPVRLLSRVGAQGQFRACFQGEGPPDFAGVALGRAVAFDAKDCSGSRWHLGELARHQARDLEAWSLAGGTAFVALRLGGEGWVLPWAHLGPLWWAWHERQGRAAPGTASIDPTAAPWTRQMPEPGDWLGALR